MTQHLKGILITTLGVLILSPDTLFIRYLNADTWTVVFWRSLVFSIGVTLLILIMYRSKALEQVKKIGKPGILIGIIFAFSSLFFTIAVQNTSIANTLVIISTSPAFAAIFSWLILKEKVALRTWMTMIVLFIAIAIIMSNSLNTGSLLGDLSATGTAIMMAISFTLTRKNKETNMIPAMAISGLIGASIAGIVSLSTGISLVLQPEAIPYLIMGGIIVTLAFALITLGPRYIPAPEVSLIMPLETVFGTLLGWVFLNEVPTKYAIVGGIIIILALVVHSWLSLKQVNKLHSRA